MNEPSSKSILLIDDDPLIREGIGRNLSARGFDVRTAVDGLDEIGRAHV